MTSANSPRNVWLTPRDREMLGFMAEHRLVLESQIAALLDSPPPAVRRRLRSLAASGYLTGFCVFEHARCCRIRPRGLAAIGSRLKAPELNLGAYRHDVGVAWLWLAAHRGSFGPVSDVIGERRLRSHDMRTLQEPYSIRLGGSDTQGRQLRHYPDLLLVDRHGRRLALELELSLKEKPRREQILAGYGADRRVDGVVYLVEDDPRGRSLGHAIHASAVAMGLTDRIHVRPVTPIALGAATAARAGKPTAAHAGMRATDTSVQAAR